MAFLGKAELGVREIGVSVDIQSDPRARLMYYLSCMSTVLDLDDSPNLSRLTNYSNYFLSEDETFKLVTFCLLLSPELLLNKCIFQDDDMCGNSENNFFEISAVQQKLLLTDSLVIGGIQRAVRKIMTFKMTWLERYWREPIKELMRQPMTPSIERDANFVFQPAPVSPSSDSVDECCGCCGGKKSAETENVCEGTMAYSPPH
ncbi:hypothetical protein CHS0354_028417 [Potamilus streckersoni]|uniref:Uncharacterized protein n=1 Tax=Potamilus streckersoni TaxID=2493646 RepID=A0AAE0SR24_9BIVA|nr:hypothetical protein CHS0354_028417 [Potamilus streckersoni]